MNRGCKITLRKNKDAQSINTEKARGKLDLRDLRETAGYNRIKHLEGRGAENPAYCTPKNYRSRIQQPSDAIHRGQGHPPIRVDLGARSYSVLQICNSPQIRWTRRDCFTTKNEWNLKPMCTNHPVKIRISGF